MMMRRDSGFTLIEIAIVVVIIGLLLVPLFALYQQHLEKQKIRLTRAHIEQAGAEISYFFTNTLRYPCPSDRAAPEGTPSYADEFHPACDPAAIGLSVGGCTPGGGLCLVAGMRDADGDGVNDPVLIGGLPVRALKTVNASTLADRAGYDSWGSRLTYAVTLSLTATATYRNYGGAIAAIDEFNRATAGIENDAQYAVVSHGPDIKGGFGRTGAQIIPCGTAAESRDHENCDNDAVFMQALGAYKAAGATYYDDYSYFNKSRSTTLWAYIAGTGHIYNLNSGDVGVGTDAPQARLDVAGTLRASNTTRTTRLCDAGGLNCFDTRAITGAGIIRCGGDQAMRGIDNAAALCVTPSFSPPLPNQDCGTGWVVGFTSEGAAICGP